ncbi:MAG: hypothetical protein KF812_03040 [Fimbriimonadaceae bacterium]|nr:hypothetical protein [Fimbriimonadaceae bacterium]
MRTLGLLLLVLVAGLMGCQPQESAAEDVPETEPTAQTQTAPDGGGYMNPGAPQAPTGSSGGVGITTAGAGGLAPVTGSDSVGGAGGGGVQQAAKDSARRAADRAGSMTGGSMGSTGE